MKKHEKAGPGLKQCPGCQFYIGVRTKQCDCGQITDSDNRVDDINSSNDGDNDNDDDHKQTSEIIKPKNTQKIWVMEGKCPIELESLSEDSILKWAKKLRKYYLDKSNEFITGIGIANFLDQFILNLKIRPFNVKTDDLEYIDEMAKKISDNLTLYNKKRKFILNADKNGLVS